VRFESLPYMAALPRWLNQWHYSRSAQAAAQRLGLEVVHSHENTFFGQIQTLHVQTVRSNLFGPLAKRSAWANRLKVATSPRLAFYLAAERSRLHAPQPVFASQALKADTLPYFAHLAHLVSAPVITPGTHLSALAPLEHAATLRLQARQAWATVPAHATWLLMAANDPRKKGLDAALGALQRLPPQHHLLLAGKPDQHTHYRAEAQRLGLTQRLHFLGPVAEMPQLYTACDLLLHPTLQDAYPMVVLEAMAHGLPVVTTPAPYNGLSAQLQHLQHAWLLPPNDPEALAQACRQHHALAAMRPAAHAFAAQHSWAEIAEQYAALYRAQLSAN
jgi:glycosyltransferase involved in cell wall biosynthesis